MQDEVLLLKYRSNSDVSLSYLIVATWFLPYMLKTKLCGLLLSAVIFHCGVYLPMGWLVQGKEGSGDLNVPRRGCAAW